jgi:WD40 repeat protein
VWDLARGRLERTLKSHAPVTAVAVTADGRIISGGRDGTIRVWDLARGRLERTLKSHAPVTAVAVTADGRVVSGGGYTVRVWHLASGTEVARWVTDARAISSCAAHPRDPNTLVYGDSHGRVITLLVRESHSAIGTSPAR